MANVNPLTGIDVVAAAGGNLQLQNALTALISASGAQTVNTDTGKIVATTTPKSYGLKITGQDGTFLIDIALPTPGSQYIRRTQANEGKNTVGKAVQHQLRCSDDIDVTRGVITYGPDTRVHWEIPMPDTRKYWQLRSSYDGNTWNDWQFWIDPGLCGAALVWSGQVRSTSIMPNVPPNVTNYCHVDSISDGAGHATIRVYGSGGVGSTWNWQVGANLKTGFPAGMLTGYAYSTAYYVIYDTQSQIFRVFTTTQYPSILPDPYIFCGKLTTVLADGTSGTTGGGGDTGGSDGCTEVGTPLYFDATTESVQAEIIENSDWIALRFAPTDDPLLVHPDTLVGVWKRARDVQPKDLVDVGENGLFLPLHSAESLSKPSHKQKLQVLPGRAYRAGARKVKLHNLKPAVP